MNTLEVIDLRAPSPAVASHPEPPAQHHPLNDSIANSETDSDSDSEAEAEGHAVPSASNPSPTLTGPASPSVADTLPPDGSPSPPPLPEKDTAPKLAPSLSSTLTPDTSTLAPDTSTLAPGTSDLAVKMAMMGLRTPPAPRGAPPSPPLTPLTPGASEGGHHRHVRTSWVEDDLETTSALSRDEDDEDGSTGPSTKEAAVPAADDAVHAAFGKACNAGVEGSRGGEGAANGNANGQAGEDPAHPLSPPAWETVDPPAGNGANPYGSSRTRIHEFSSSKPLRSRPLVPYSSYYFGPPPADAAYGTPPVGQIGVHHPREIVRIERDYSAGELPQFAPIYPLEFEGRLTPTQFLETINAINEILISAHSLTHSFVDNALSFFTLQTSRLVLTSHYEKEMDRLKALIADFNVRTYNSRGLNILWPRKVAFMFLEIEYY